jgi:rfaE bifunctional protein kinase chain/domain
MSKQVYGAKTREITPLTESRLQWILDRITRTHVLVLGDYCLDIYWLVDSSRSEKSFETRLPTNPVREQRYSLGGAGNVANNLVDMGCRDVWALGVIGDDPWGRETMRLLLQIGVKTQDVIVQKQRWSTLAYAKPQVRGMESNRFDFGNFNALSSQAAQALLERCRIRVPEADAIIVNQQVRQGVHTGELREGLVSLIREFPEKLFIVDSRHFSESYAGAFIKVNDREATRLCGKAPAPEAPVIREGALAAAAELFKRFGKPVFVTRGSQGIMVADDRGVSEIPGIQTTGRVDTVGAGDSALAGIALALAAGSETAEAAQLGNLVARITVQKLNQTGTASPGEILAMFHAHSLGVQ